MFIFICTKRPFTAEEPHKLIVYLHGALCESLRLFPPLVLDHKAPARPDILPSRHRLARNEKLIISFYSVGRMESIWWERLPRIQAGEMDLSEREDQARAVVQVSSVQRRAEDVRGEGDGVRADEDGGGGDSI